jgi:hypothetical protein
MLLVQIVRIPVEGVADFHRYESLVLPLLAKYGARLERRLRSADGTFELHLLWVPSVDALERYRTDPERVAALPLFERSAATAELLEVTDIVEP